MNAPLLTFRFESKVILCLCATQVQKLRKALEKVGKEFKVKDMDDLKVT